MWQPLPADRCPDLRGGVRTTREECEERCSIDEGSVAAPRGRPRSEWGLSAGFITRPGGSLQRASTSEPNRETGRHRHCPSAGLVVNRLKARTRQPLVLLEVAVPP